MIWTLKCVTPVQHNKVPFTSNLHKTELYKLHSDRMLYVYDRAVMFDGDNELVTQFALPL